MDHETIGQAIADDYDALSSEAFDVSTNGGKNNKQERHPTIPLGMEDRPPKCYKCGCILGYFWECPNDCENPCKDPLEE